MSRSVMPVRCAICAQACTAQARISRSCGPGRSRRPASMCAASALVEHEHAVAAQDVGHEVVGEDRQAVEVAEARDAGALEVAAARSARACRSRGRRTSPCRRPASPPAARPTRRPRRTTPQRASRSPRNAPSWRSAWANSAMSSWSRGWPSDVGDLVGRDAAQLRRAPGAVLAEAVGQAPRDGEVARQRPAVRARRLRSVGNQPEPKLIVSSVRMYAATSSGGPSR